VLILLTTSLAKFTKNFTLPKTWETPGSISKAMCSISHGELLNFQQALERAKIMNQEFLSPMIQILKVTRRQEKDGRRVSIFTTLTISSRPRRMLLMLETVSS